MHKKLEMFEQLTNENLYKFRKPEVIISISYKYANPDICIKSIKNNMNYVHNMQIKNAYVNENS